MYLLLSPAKNLNETLTAKNVSISTPALIDDANIIMQTLRQLDYLDICELMKVSAKIGKLNQARNAKFCIPFDDSAKAAIFLFDGDAYKGLNAPELQSSELDYLNARLGILSGLYGLLRPYDAIMPYRLEMGTKLSVNGHDNLYQYWGDTITKLLKQRMDSIGANTLVNLASHEYFSAIDTKKLSCDIVNIRFEDQKNGQYKIISFYAKRARGLMTRFCAVNNITDAKSLKDFDMQGYYFVSACDDATGQTYVFRRDEIAR